MLNDQVIFYNYAAGFVMERALLAAGDWSGGPRSLIIRFGHVRRFDHASTQSYFSQKAKNCPAWMPWHLLHGDVHFSDQASWDGLQAADQYAGMLSAALRPDDYGGYEESHLLRIRHQIRRDTAGRAWGRGFKLLGDPAAITSLPWWPPNGI